MIFKKKKKIRVRLGPPTSILISDFWKKNSLQSPLSSVIVREVRYACPSVSARFQHQIALVSNPDDQHIKQVCYQMS